MSNYVTAIGLDVHARSIKACALNPMTGEVERASFGYDPASVAEWALSFESPKAVYESGVNGFHLCRVLRALGLDCAPPPRRTCRCARTGRTTSAPRPPTSCGSPTSRSSGCPAGRSATRRPSSTASTAGPSRGRSAGTPRRGLPTPRSRRPAGRWHPVRRRPSTATAAATTAGRGGSRSARRTGWPGACRARA